MYTRAEQRTATCAAQSPRARAAKEVASCGGDGWRTGAARWLPVRVLRGGLLKARQRSGLLRECTVHRYVLSHERGGMRVSLLHRASARVKFR